MKISFLTVIFILFSAVGYHFFFTPVFKDARATHAEYNELIEIFNDSQQLSDLRDKILSDYSSVSERDRGVLNRVIPYKTDEEILIFLSEVEEIANANNNQVDIKSYNLRPNLFDEDESADGGEYQKLTVSFRVDASYFNIKGFLGDIYNNNRIMFPTRLSLTGGSGVGIDGRNVDSDVWNIEIGTYFRKQI